MKAKSIIIEDELAGLNNLKKKLMSYCPEIEVVGSAHSVESGIQILKEQKPSLVFMDIELSPGYAFDILEKLTDIKFEIIFTTGYEYSEYMHKAIDYDAVDYLVKPIAIEDLKKAIKKALKRISNHTFAEINAKDNLLKLNDSKGIRIVEESEILHIEAKDGYLQFFLTSLEKVTVWTSLKRFKEHLNPSLFFRVHHAHIIHRKHIKMIMREEGGTLLLKNNTKVPISRRNKAAFMQWFENNLTP